MLFPFLRKFLRSKSHRFELYSSRASISSDFLITKTSSKFVLLMLSENFMILFFLVYYLLLFHEVKILQLTTFVKSFCTKTTVFNIIQAQKACNTLILTTLQKVIVLLNIYCCLLLTILKFLSILKSHFDSAKMLQVKGLDRYYQFIKKKVKFVLQNRFCTFKTYFKIDSLIESFFIYLLFIYIYSLLKEIDIIDTNIRKM